MLDFLMNFPFKNWPGLNGALQGIMVAIVIWALMSLGG